MFAYLALLFLFYAIAALVTYHLLKRYRASGSRLVLVSLIIGIVFAPSMLIFFGEGGGAAVFMPATIVFSLVVYSCLGGSSCRNLMYAFSFGIAPILVTTAIAWFVLRFVLRQVNRNRMAMDVV